MRSLFEFSSHFDYLAEKLSPANTKYGQKARFADHVQIQASFLSQVIAKKYSLNMEQADLANSFFEHTLEESAFFISLVSRDRAGTVSLKNFYNLQINEILKKRQIVIERLGKKFEVSEVAKGIYYSSWIYPAVHLACSLSKSLSASEIASLLKISPEIALKTIEFLLESNLIVKKNDRLESTESWIRIDRTSAHVVKHHTNWRLKAIQNLEHTTEEDLNYSGLYSMNRETALKVKDRLLEVLKPIIKEIENSPETSLYQLNLDFFSVLKTE